MVMFAISLGTRRLAKLLGLSAPGASAAMMNVSYCPANCTFPKGKCIDGKCICELQFSGESCDIPNNNYLTAFATIFYLLFVIASVQLILCMINDSLSGEQRWKKAFRVTIQKCILGTVITAAGTRGIYFTVQKYINERWADVLHNVYYPALLTAFSILICFWAEVFYHNSELVHSQRFIKKHSYFVGCVIFNVLVYLLCLADIIATPLVSDVELARKSNVVGCIFLVLLVVMLVGFLHYGIRLFFRPDWRPLSQVFQINLKQQTFSCLGVVSSALMQSLVISLLLMNLVEQLFSVEIDAHSLYTSDLVVQIIELLLPIWFCCSLWNFKRPSSLWILNPSLLLKAVHDKVTESETDPLLSGTVQGYGTVGAADLITTSGSAPPECWICLDKGEVCDLFKPCRCSAVHRNCLSRWMAERAAQNPSSETFKCQVCKSRYKLSKKKWKCIPRGIKPLHWIAAVGVTLVLVIINSMFGLLNLIGPTVLKVGLICVIIALDSVIIKVVGFGLVRLYKRSKVAVFTIVGESVPLRPKTLPLANESSDEESAAITILVESEQSNVESEQISVES